MQHNHQQQPVLASPVSASRKDSAAVQAVTPFPNPFAAATSLPQSPNQHYPSLDLLGGGRATNYGSTTSTTSAGVSLLSSSFGDSLTLSASSSTRSNSSSPAGVGSAAATQRYGSCSSSTDTTASADPGGSYGSLPSASCSSYPPSPAQQPGAVYRYPRIENSGSSSSSYTTRYPTVPGSSFVNRSDSTASDQAWPPGRTASGTSSSSSFPQPLPMPASPPQHKHKQQQAGRWQPSGGLYPVVSGEQCVPGQQWQHTQQQQYIQQQQQSQQQKQHRQQTSNEAQAQVLAPWGYDVQVVLQQVSELPTVCDPYVLILMHLGDGDVLYRTEPQYDTRQAVYSKDDNFKLANVQLDCILRCEVWDKNLSDDVMVARCSWSFAKQLQAAASADGTPASNGQLGAAAARESSRDQGPVSSCGAAATPQPADAQLASSSSSTAAAAATTIVCATLDLSHPTKSSKALGRLQLQVSYQLSLQEGAPRMLGPVCFRQHLCPATGVLTGHWSTEDAMCYSTYKLFLCHINSVFGDVRMKWNTDYTNARLVFNNPLVLQAVKTQHRAMYATQAGKSRGGALRTAADFFALLNYGMRDGQRRFFTYVLCEDSLRCSETGAAFATDLVSKHAMHAGGAEEVLFAGEFCIMPSSQAAAGRHKLVIDNNSGTYAPHKCRLQLMQQLFALNFAGMEVEVLDWRDPKLDYYHSLCPSRVVVSTTAAAAASASSSSSGGHVLLLGSKGAVPISA